MTIIILCNPLLTRVNPVDTLFSPTVPNTRCKTRVLREMNLNNELSNAQWFFVWMIRIGFQAFSWLCKVWNEFPWMYSKESAFVNLNSLITGKKSTRRNVLKHYINVRKIVRERNYDCGRKTNRWHIESDTSKIKYYPTLWTEGAQASCDIYRINRFIHLLLIRSQ